MAARERDTEMAATFDYFALLGVGEDVSQDEIEARYQDLSRYLASAEVPSSLRDWAKKQAALVDEAYAFLADPERRVAARKSGEVAERARTGDRTTHRSARTDAAKPKRSEPKRQEEPSPPAAGRQLFPVNARGVIFGGLFGAAVLAAILFGRYGLPSGSAGSADEPQAPAAAEGVSLERVAELMAELEKDPGDASVLFELGETYFMANDWQNSIDWFTRLLAVDTSNVHALTDIGTSQYNLGNYDAAKEAWTGVLEIDADDVQAHYNLGFLYANTEPQDLEAAKREWQLVLELDPASELAAIAKAHLDGVSEEAASGGDSEP